MKQRVSVILPTYNRAHLIEETIQSLLEQTRIPDEILVIDDGSTDATPEVLAHFDCLTVLRIENGGKAAALNLALGKVSGDLVWIVDDDDIMLPHACMSMATALEADPDLDFCAGRHIDFEVDKRTGAKNTRPPGFMCTSSPDQIFPDLLEGCFIFQPGLMVRKSVYESVGPFNTGLVRSQDYEMILRIARRHRGRQLDEVVFLHREHDGQRGSANENFAAAENSDRWAHFNRIIFADLLDDLADEEVLAEGDVAHLSAPLRRRAALVKRGCIMARQRMWHEAVKTWREAAAVDSAPLSLLECKMLERSPNSPLGATELFLDSAVRLELKALMRMSSPGPEMIAVLRRASRWHIRAALRMRDWHRAAQGVRVMLAR